MAWCLDGGPHYINVSCFSSNLPTMLKQLDNFENFY